MLYQFTYRELIQFTEWVLVNKVIGDFDGDVHLLPYNSDEERSVERLYGEWDRLNRPVITDEQRSKL